MQHEAPIAGRVELSPLREDAAWDPLPIAMALNAAYAQRADERYGLGIRFSLGDEAALDLTIFPRTEVVLLASPEASIVLHHQGQPTVQEDAVVFLADLPSERRLLHLTSS